MPKLSLWNPNKKNDYRWFDRIIREQFHVGGTGAIIHKYLGPEENQDEVTPTRKKNSESNETTIQDILFLENRDRKYDKNLYELKSIYQVSDNDFDLNQFLLFLTNDTLYMSFHLNEMVEIIGRKLMNGDVLELSHLLENYSLDADTPPIPKYYVVQDGNRSGEGFSPTWWPHIWRVKVGPITDSQEFDDILGHAKDQNSQKNIFSNYSREIDITNDIVLEGFANDPFGGKPLTSHIANYVDKNGFQYNPGGDIEAGNSFPDNADIGDFFIREDYVPSRLFVRQENRWIRLYDNIDDKTWADNTLNASSFINNRNTAVINGEEVRERQNPSKAILPRTGKFKIEAILDNSDQFIVEKCYVSPTGTGSDSTTSETDNTDVGNAVVSVQSDAPSSPTQGQLWLNTSTGRMYVNCDGNWIGLGGIVQETTSTTTEAEAPVTVSSTKPSNPVNGDLWFDTSSTNLYVYFSDGDSSQWLSVN